MNIRKNFIAMLAIILTITCMPMASFADSDAGSEVEMQKGKIIMIHDGKITTIDMRNVIIFDENGNIVPRTRADWQFNTSVTLKNGYGALITAEPVYYSASPITMYASCSVGKVTGLQGEARLVEDSNSEIMGKFKATKGTWYGKLKYNLGWVGNTLLYIRNASSDTITVDSVTYDF
ncbi:hypothetical protein Ami103574_13805 [Aminipila butyrica]|uniref:DUF5626 domain-containing protein n=1 Tax=Aminipila butyrica TaxID=433296 RepID=A0A858BYK4_9FIRM|nr:hypothetical protein [Aminipila butyrica]QIB70299.1 hypothetical protein Ami103574_13805 [Aminipila butyrica]